MAAARLPIGVTIGSLGESAGWWLESARRLDEAGYHAIWTWDHFVGKGDRRTPVQEAWTLLSAGAVVTRRALLGPFVLNVMNRHPAVVARAAATLQQISGGRLRLGLGIGGHAPEHEAYGIDFPVPPERVVHLREAVSVMRALWTGGPVTFEGRHYRLRDAHASPAAEPPPPILVGGETRGGVRLAAEVGDGWAAEEEYLDRLMPVYLEALEAAGKTRASQTVVVGFPGGWSGRSVLRDNPFVAAPREVLAGWLERDVDEVTLTARTTEDIDLLVAAAERW